MTQPIDPSVQYPTLLWDVTFEYDSTGNFDYLAADWRIDTDRKDLRRDSALHTAVLYSLFTDRRAPDGVVLPFDDDDRRGWWGDYVDVRASDGEEEMGSYLWLYERSILNAEVEERVRVEAERCLQHLKKNGVAARVDVFSAYVRNSGANDGLLLTINIYSRSGELRYSQKFHKTWLQTFPGMAT